MKDIYSLLADLKAQSESQFPDPARLLGLIDTLAKGPDRAVLKGMHAYLTKTFERELRDLAKKLMRRYEADYAKQAERETVEEILKALKALFDLLPPVEQPISKTRPGGFGSIAELIDTISVKVPTDFLELLERTKRLPTGLRNMYPKTPAVHPTLATHEGEYVLGRVGEESEFPQEVRLRTVGELTLCIGGSRIPWMNWSHLDKHVGRLFRSWVERHEPETNLHAVACTISPYGEFAPTPHLVGVFLGHHVWGGKGYWWIDKEFHSRGLVARALPGQGVTYNQLYTLPKDAQAHLYTLLKCIYSP